MTKFLIKHLFFRFEPETAHEMVMRLLQLPLLSRLLGKLYYYEHPSLSRTVFGLTFPNPVGLAAGFDKDARVVDRMADLGFGFVEIGTVTPKPQPGNPRPRLFRLPRDRALINRMGFNNEGVGAAVERLKRPRKRIIVGGNIGKNKFTPNETAWQDYEICFKALFPVVDYFVVNVSSPNTPKLRELQERKPLTELLVHLQHQNRARPAPKPILLKIAPDITTAQMDDIIEIVEETGIAGVIATNTTIRREGLQTPQEELQKMGAGGLSGKPLHKRATDVIRYIHRASGGQIPIIGVGGIMTPQDALEKIAAGAVLVQIYTGFIYEGPRLVKQIKQQIVGRDQA